MNISHDALKDLTGHAELKAEGTVGMEREYSLSFVPFQVVFIFSF